jgi:hypothetical protein
MSDGRQSRRAADRAEPLPDRRAGEDRRQEPMQTDDTACSSVTPAATIKSDE